MELVLNIYMLKFLFQLTSFYCNTKMKSYYLLRIKRVVWLYIVYFWLASVFSNFFILTKFFYFYYISISLREGGGER